MEPDRGGSRTRTPSPQQPSRTEYQCGCCRKVMPKGQWQEWQLVEEREGYINLLSPTYSDAKGKKWATLCEHCQVAQAIFRLMRP